MNLYYKFNQLSFNARMALSFSLIQYGIALFFDPVISQPLHLHHFFEFIGLYYVGRTICEYGLNLVIYSQIYLVTVLVALSLIIYTNPFTISTLMQSALFLVFLYLIFITGYLVQMNSN